MAIEYSVDILSLCSQETRYTLQRYCSIINHSKADVFILMANKAVQLIQILRDQNLIYKDTPSVIFVSDKALDFDTSYFSGKKVAIVDDIIISGSSISSTVNKLLNCGVMAENIEIIVLATNSDYLSMSFSNSKNKEVLYSAKALCDATCVELSNDLSRIFSFYGVPYDCDFPLYELSGLDYNEELPFLKLQFGKVYDITTDINTRGNIESFVVFPNPAMRKQVWDNLRVNLDEYVQLKLRVYAQKHPSGRVDYRFVPMALFNEINDSALSALYNIVTKGLGPVDCNNRCIAQVRILAFYIAQCFGDVTFETLRQSHIVTLCEDTAIILFGAVTGKQMLSYFCTPKSEVLDSESTIDFGNIPEPELFNYTQSELYLSNYASYVKSVQAGDLDGYNRNAQLLLPFKWHYTECELPTRNTMKASHFHYINDYSLIKKHISRLKEGFSFKALKKILKDCEDVYDTDRMVSLFIDRGVDEGIIVPIIYCNNDKHYVCRAYRHGEDLPFGDADECRFLLFLKTLHEVLSTKGYALEIASVTFEKFIVLFYQICLREGNILNRFLGFDNIPLLKQRFSIHGAIAGIVEPREIALKGIVEHVYSERAADGDRYLTWLTTWAMERNIIVQNSSSDGGTHKYYTVQPAEIDACMKKHTTSNISHEIKTHIQSIANMLAAWYICEAAQRRKDKFKDDITALTSCANIYVYASSIATGLHYFKKYWDSQVQDGFDAINQGRSGAYFFNYADMAQTLESGRNKHQWYRKKRANSVILEVSKLFENAYHYKSLWDKIWNSVLTNSVLDSDLEAKVIEGLGYLYFFSACYDYLSGDYLCSTALPSRFLEYKSQYAECCASNVLLDETLFQLFDAIRQEDNCTALTTILNEKVYAAIAQSESIINDIEDFVRQDTTAYSVIYTSCLVVRFKPINVSMADDYIMKLWERLSEDEVKTGCNIFKFPDIPHGYRQYGIFYNSPTIIPATDENVLLHCFSELSDILHNHVYDSSYILIPQIPSQFRVIHNIKDRIAEIVERFTCKFIKPLDDQISHNSILSGKSVSTSFILLATQQVDFSYAEYISRLASWDNISEQFTIRIETCTQNISLRKYEMYYIDQRTDMPVALSSSVRFINCSAEYLGMGILFRTDTRVVCITCRHILGELAIGDIISASFEAHNCRFPLRVIGFGVGNTNTAFEEIAVLEFADKEHSVDPSSLFSNESFIGDEEIMNTTFKCYACISSSGGKWVTNLNPAGHLGNGYYQLIDSSQEICSGYSGSAVISPNNKLLGIHKGHDGRSLFVISKSAIRDVLNRLTE